MHVQANDTRRDRHGFYPAICCVTVVIEVILQEHKLESQMDENLKDWAQFQRPTSLRSGSLQIGLRWFVYQSSVRG